jgi:hypothetical protein
VRGRESSDPLAGERPGIPGSKSAHPVLPVSATPTTGAVGSRTGRRLGAGDGSPFIGDLRRCPRPAYKSGAEALEGLASGGRIQNCCSGCRTTRGSVAENSCGTTHNDER